MLEDNKNKSKKEINKNGISSETLLKNRIISHHTIQELLSKEII